ncbi:MAG: Alpha/beta hydrolase family protein [Armatimonadetes bacterium OLB18]|nr:MAG: Alpha/beta hydrolase family protein [Armatimonadetes bacterium OLB18]
MHLVLSLLLLLSAEPAQSKLPIELREGLAIRGVTRGGRVPFPLDAVQYAIVAGTFAKPEGGAEIEFGEAKRIWERLVAEEDGSIRGSAFSGGYAYFEVERPQREIAILEATGHGMAYVNGEPLAGDPYGYGYSKLPVDLKEGPNALLFASGRGNFRAKLTPPPASAFFNLSDATLPDLLEGDSAPNWAGVILVNATRSPLTGLVVRTQVEGGKAADTETPSARTPLDLQGGDSNRSLRYDRRFDGRPQAHADPLRSNARLPEAQLRVRGPRQTRKVTFLSQIDGSVQYYALNPATDDAPGKALILSTHGASVEAIGQADAYSPKPWANLVAPTNRRPYGFDWEDWGRKDALEVLEHASQKLQADRSRTYVTGHSMGGHGAWYLGLTFPDLFSAMAPSAGWVSFFSYAGGQRIEPSTGIADLFSRAANPSDTLGLVRNSSKQNVYILHGDKDDNVPVREARSMNVGAGSDRQDVPISRAARSGPLVGW